MYEAYLTVEEYSGPSSGLISDARLRKASREIDALTFNRIVGRFSELTEFQRELIREVCSELAVWEAENADLLNSVLKSYSINGVSVEFGGITIREINGVIIPSRLYNKLEQTGLCCRKVGRY